MSSHLSPILTVDVVLLTLDQGELKVALMPRTQEPFAGTWSLVGGYVRPEEDASLTQAARRILRQKLSFEPQHLEEVCTHSGATRDPRGWSASVVFVGLHALKSLELLLQDKTVTLYSLDELRRGVVPLAFDHLDLIELAVERLQSKARYTTLLAHFLPSVFTLPELHSVYERVLGVSLNAQSFRRKITEREALEEVAVVQGKQGRPATAYRLKDEVTYFDKQLA